MLSALCLQDPDTLPWRVVPAGLSRAGMVDRQTDGQWELRLSARTQAWPPSWGPEQPLNVTVIEGALPVPAGPGLSLLTQPAAQKVANVV